MKPFLLAKVLALSAMATAICVLPAAAATIYNDHGYIAVLIIREGPNMPPDRNPQTYNGSSEMGDRYSSHHAGSQGTLCYRRSRIWEDASSGLTNWDCASGDDPDVDVYKIN